MYKPLARSVKVHPLAASAFGFVALAALAGSALADGVSAPESLVLTGIVRDFKEFSVPGGHPDFEVTPSGGYAQYCANVNSALGGDEKPVFTGAGWKLNSQWRNAAGNNICHLMYNSALGDVAGSKGAASTGGVHSADSFYSWFRDVPGVNMSKALNIQLNRQESGSYLFNSASDEPYHSLGGFFPIENELFGNPGGSPNRNFHFTFELHTEFTYDAAGSQVFRFTGDDDVWVYVGNQLVIDIGGIHGATDQQIDLNRLGLTNGEDYKLHFFFAERHRTQSNCKITTNLQLATVSLPTVSAAFD